jgi:hypothetical protein
LDYGAKDNPLKTSRAGDMVTHYIDHMLAQVGDSITWPESVQQRLDAREVLLGLFHARVAKSAMFVDDIIVVGIIDAAKALPLASKEILESGLGEDLGYNTELKKLQTGGAIAEYVGLKLRVDAPLAEAPPIGINLPAWKADAYIAQLQELQDDDHVWIDLQAVEQISGRMVHASSVWAEILLTLGPIYEMIYAQVADLKYKHKRRRTQAAAQAFADCEAIIQRNSPRPFFPSVRRFPIGAPELGVGFSDVSKPGEDGPVPGIDHFVGFWCALPDGRVLYGSMRVGANLQRNAAFLSCTRCPGSTPENRGCDPPCTGRPGNSGTVHRQYSPLGGRYCKSDHLSGFANLYQTCTRLKS